MTEPEIPEGVAKHVREAIVRPQKSKLPYKPGDFIGQKYEVHGLLGEGAFGVVYLVLTYESNEVKNVLALKTFHDRYFKEAITRDMLRRDAKNWMRLERHPYLVRAYVVDEVDGRLYIAMEYITPDEHGLNTLHDYLNDPYNSPDLAQSLKWAIQFCHGMEYAYSKGIKCHRDIKPKNIMISHDKTLKISDFGIAVVVGEEDVGVPSGYRGYEAPEGGRDERSDIYSFGVVLWQMATGSPNPPQKGRFRGIPSVDGPLQSIIQRCLNNNPVKRYQKFEDLRKELELLYKKETGKGPEPPPDKIELEVWELVNKGASLGNLGRHVEAILCYNKAIEINPRYAEAYNNRGIAYDKKGEYDRAIADFSKALEINPRDAEAYYNRGIAYGDKGEYDRAILDYNKAIEINPRYAEAYNNRGIAYDKKGEYDRAILDYNEAIEINPRHAEAYNNRGSAYDKKGEYDRAIADFSNAIEINPRLAEAYYNRAVAYYATGEYNKAWEDVDEAEGLGYQVNPKLLELLRQASGRRR